MLKAIIFLTGIIMFILSLYYGLSIIKGQRLASSLDKQETSYAAISEGPLPCTWDTNLSSRVIPENKSQAIIIQFSNTYDEKCETILTLRSPGFDTTPNKEEQKINLESKSQGSLSWILTPRKIGTFEITISDIINTKILGITVNNIFGLSATYAKLLSISGSLMGPMLTVPWWVEKLITRRRFSIKKDEKSEKEVTIN